MFDYPIQAFRLDVLHDEHDLEHLANVAALRVLLSDSQQDDDVAQPVHQLDKLGVSGGRFLAEVFGFDVAKEVLVLHSGIDEPYFLGDLLIREVYPLLEAIPSNGFELLGQDGGVVLDERFEGLIERLVYLDFWVAEEPDEDLYILGNAIFEEAGVLYVVLQLLR